MTFLPNGGVAPAGRSPSTGLGGDVPRWLAAQGWPTSRASSAGAVPGRNRLPRVRVMRTLAITRTLGSSGRKVSAIGLGGKGLSHGDGTAADHQDGVAQLE
jgi:hypothetical protein